MATTNWKLDLSHSELGFKIKHLMITNVSGTFKSFDVEVESEDDDFRNARITAKADMSSINTNNEQRDEHLRNSDFFEVDKYPELSFRSTGSKAIDDDTYELHGELTLKGVTKPVKLHVEYNGLAKDPWGGERAGFVVTGKINRADWGVSFNGVLETGGVMLSEEVRIHAELELVRETVAELA